MQPRCGAGASGLPVGRAKRGHRIGKDLRPGAPLDHHQACGRADWRPSRPSRWRRRVQWCGAVAPVTGRLAPHYTQYAHPLLPFDPPGRSRCSLAATPALGALPCCGSCRARSLRRGRVPLRRPSRGRRRGTLLPSPEGAQPPNDFGRAPSRLTAVYACLCTGLRRAPGRRRRGVSPARSARAARTLALGRVRQREWPAARPWRGAWRRRRAATALAGRASGRFGGTRGCGGGRGALSVAAAGVRVRLRGRAEVASAVGCDERRRRRAGAARRGGVAVGPVRERTQGFSYFSNSPPQHGPLSTDDTRVHTIH